jgi:hypothetical protein
MKNTQIPATLEPSVSITFTRTIRPDLQNGDALESQLKNDALCFKCDQNINQSDASMIFVSK